MSTRRFRAPALLTLFAGLLVGGCGGGESDGTSVDFTDLPGAGGTELGGVVSDGTTIGGDRGAGAVDGSPSDGGPTDATVDVAADMGPARNCPGGFGCPCETGAECLSAFCVPSITGLVCTETCIESCSEDGWACRRIEQGGDPIQICLQTSSNLCVPCITDEECISAIGGDTEDRCVLFGEQEGSFCGTVCAGDGDCPDGFECLDVAGPGEAAATVCLPRSKTCECNAYGQEVGARTSCSRANEHGTCGGLRVCTTEGLSGCDAPEPAPEVCDAIDNDCDGDTDEGVASTDCMRTGPLGSCPGRTVCQADGTVGCDAPEAAEEICDGLDNDCDDAVDEGFPDADGDGTADCVDDDADDDGVTDDMDNCPSVANADQADNDGDTVGDACDFDDDADQVPDDADNCPLDANPRQEDADGDGEGNACDRDDDNDDVFDVADNCPLVPNPDQADVDGDGAGDRCDGDADGDGIPDEGDNCRDVENQEQIDLDADGLGDACDPDDDGDGVIDLVDLCPRDVDPQQQDNDGDGDGDRCDPDDDDDGVFDVEDNCPLHPNPDQADGDRDNAGDECDPDADGDGVTDTVDNCPGLSNPGQADLDTDGAGDDCDDDDDNDQAPDESDSCPRLANGDQADLDGDGVGDVCDTDDDGDGIPDAVDNCPRVANEGQEDFNEDRIGDVCDPDRDGDGVANGSDNCPAAPNEGQEDIDSDGVGDRCDADRDGDGVCDTIEEVAGECRAGPDNCRDEANVDQSDADGDSRGDVCDTDDDNDGVPDDDDNCPLVSNPNQRDDNGNGTGDACDDDDDGDGDPDVTDCNPRNPQIHHGATEVCNGVDDNCDDVTDEEGSDGCVDRFFDGDGDGAGAEQTPAGVAPSRCLCRDDGFYRARVAGDCDDTEVSVGPQGTERCNGVDDDCDGETDEASAVDAADHWLDADDDGWGTGDPTRQCGPIGDVRATRGRDCDDTRKAVNPGAIETCNGLDDDCDGSTDPDETTVGCTNYHLDNDGDGYGAPLTVCSCAATAPEGFADNADDCCDSDNRAHPGVSGWFASATNCGTFDYNCDRQATRRWPEDGQCACNTGCIRCTFVAGFAGGSAQCGDTRSFLHNCVDGLFSCDGETETRTQECR